MLNIVHNSVVRTIVSSCLDNAQLRICNFVACQRHRHEAIFVLGVGTIYQLHSSEPRNSSPTRCLGLGCFLYCCSWLFWILKILKLFKSNYNETINKSNIILSIELWHVYKYVISI